MFEKVKRKTFLTVFLLFLAVVLIFLPPNIPLLDQKEDEFFETAIKKAVLTYATVRGINAAVSVAKETEISATPLGVGIDIHIGEVLDPIDDAVERLSSTLTISMAGLFLVKVFSDIFQEYIFKILSFLLIVTSFLIWLKNERLIRFFISIILFIFVVRITLPACGILNSFLYKNYFEPKISQNTETLKSIYKNSNKIEEKNKGIFYSVKEETQKIDELLEKLKGNADKIVMAVINLILLNISMLFIQIMIIPLGIILFLYKMLSLIKI